MKLADILIPAESSNQKCIVLFANKPYVVLVDRIQNNNHIHFTSNIVNVEYIYYYMILNSKLIKKQIPYGECDNIKQVTDVDIGELPPIEIQNEIVEDIKPLFQVTNCQNRIEILSGYIGDKIAELKVTNTYNLYELCYITNIPLFIENLLSHKFYEARNQIVITEPRRVYETYLIYYIYYTGRLHLFRRYAETGFSINLPSLENQHSFLGNISYTINKIAKLREDKKKNKTKLRDMLNDF